MTRSSENLGDVQRSPKGWEPRPLAARAVKAVQLILPFVGGWLAIRLLQPHFFDGSDNSWLAFLVWLIQAIFVSAVVSAALVHVLRRLTPLAALLNMSLVFPDSVPSRFGLALRTGTVKRLMAEPTLRLSNTAQAAAEEAVQLVAHLGKHDSHTRGHTERVRAYADVIGQQIGLSESDLNGLRWGALLHDVGKLSVPPEILNKPGAPTEDEWKVLRGHPSAAVPILEPLSDWLGDWLLAAPQHHEKWDGSGYPKGLSKENISLAGRIVAVADAYDVITSRRSYKEAMSHEAARAEMVKSSGSHFDPQVVRALLEASLTKPALARRMGWVLELPTIASTLSTAGHAVGATAAAVAMATAVTVTGPGSIADQVGADTPEAAAFLESALPDSEGVEGEATDLAGAASIGRSSKSAVDSVGGDAEQAQADLPDETSGLSLIHI